MNRDALLFTDYKRIFQTIFSLLKSENAKPENCCLLFSYWGSKILAEHYNLKNKVCSGAAAYLIGNRKNVIVFGQNVDNKLVSTSKNFHCWIETDTLVIDFMAPIFPEIIYSNFNESGITAKMFQRNKCEIVDSLRYMARNGDFLVIANDSLTSELHKRYTISQPYLDLEEICCKWYKKPPYVMPNSIKIEDKFKNSKIVKLLDFELS